MTSGSVANTLGDNEQRGRASGTASASANRYSVYPAASSATLTESKMSTRSTGRCMPSGLAIDQIKCNGSLSEKHPVMATATVPWDRGGRRLSSWHQCGGRNPTSLGDPNGVVLTARR